MVEAACHCGAVQLRIAAPPQTVTSCNCSICRKQGAILAYYAPADVQITGATEVYMWGDRMLEFHRCKICGCFTHWAAVDKSTQRMGVNARLMPPEILAAAHVRKFDGAESWTYLDE